MRTSSPKIQLGAQIFTEVLALLLFLMIIFNHKAPGLPKNGVNMANLHLKHSNREFV